MTNEEKAQLRSLVMEFGVARWKTGFHDRSSETKLAKKHANKSQRLQDEIMKRLQEIKE